MLSKEQSMTDKIDKQLDWREILSRMVMNLVEKTNDFAMLAS